MGTDVSASTSTPRRLTLRYAGSCRGRRRSLPAGEAALYYPASKLVECVDCASSVGRDGPLPGIGAAELPSPELRGLACPTAFTPPGDRTAEPVASVEIASGSAGASAQREFKRRVSRRDNRVRAAHPRLGGLILALTDEPQSTRAWERGAVGEDKLGRVLDGLSARSARVLHDRRIPGTRANIDHLVIGPGGVFVIDAKRYVGRPSLRVEGGLLRPRRETLMVGRRDRANLVAGAVKQVEVVKTALTIAGWGIAPVRGMLCFVDGDWPLFGGSFSVGGIEVLRPGQVGDRVFGAAALSVEQTVLVHALLASHFPTA